MILEYCGRLPKLHPTVFVAETAVVIGNVEIGENSSIWFGAILRGDINLIKIGSRTSIQDNCVVHVDRDKPVIVGDDVTVGHGAILHGCSIGNCVLVGMGAKVLDGAKVGDGSIIAAGSVVREGQEIPSGVLVAGIPAVVKRELDAETKELLLEHAKRYSEYAMTYL